MHVNPYQTYRQTQVETVSPQQLVIMLYNGAIKFLKLAQSGLEENNIEKSHTNNIKAQDIIFELMSALDFSQGDVAGSLFQLYDYMRRRLVEANLKKEKESLTEVEAMLTELRDTWMQALGS
ncbi:MAG: flagellar export chaperone FliS [Bacillota bacterium]|nr:flagellar export chaperone FliS [Bacillota bacterium]MDW7683023.1 flagellar export chaperone FliS [Bacillota bacterium]